MVNFIVRRAQIEDLAYTDNIVSAIYDASQYKGTGIAVRTSDYIATKIKEGKAVIALTDSGKWAGFCYIESWGHNKFVANSGLVISHVFRGQGLAKAIKERAMIPRSRYFIAACRHERFTSWRKNQNRKGAAKI